jgi:hypothetical protein
MPLVLRHIAPPDAIFFEVDTEFTKPDDELLEIVRNMVRPYRHYHGIASRLGRQAFSPSRGTDTTDRFVPAQATLVRRGA